MNEPVIIGNATLYLGDCMDILPTLGEVDAVVTDPPYGTGCAPRGGAKAGTVDFDSTIDLPWDELNNAWLKLLPPKLPVAAFCHYRTARLVGDAMRSDGLLVYVKRNPSPFGSSIETCVTRGIARKSPQHITAYNAFNGQVHPTQKPTEVMEFVCRRSPGKTILDPFMGSGTTGVACAKLGRKFIGIEIDPDYFDIACKRIDEAYKQPDMFIEPQPPKSKQSQMEI